LRALVTGASGFTGSHLVRALLERGDSVRILVRKSSDLSAIQGLRVEQAWGELGDESPLDDAVRGVDAVFHIAALYRVEGVPRRAFWDVNVGGTRKLLEAAKRAGVRRFVHCSTVGVQGDIRNPPASEGDPYAPGDHYQESKRDGEILALEFGKREKLPVTVVRPTGIYGPGDTRFLKLFKLADRGTFYMLGSGNVLYHLTYVTDLAAGILLAGSKDGAVGEVFTLGGSEPLTLNELVRKVAAALGRQVRIRRLPVWPFWVAGAACEVACRPLGLSPPIYRRRVDFFTKNRAFDISKARRLLGYEPRVALDEGLRNTARWYRERGLLG
jgi:nucleoside-diphosphate-sugar epimerase